MDRPRRGRTTPGSQVASGHRPSSGQPDWTACTLDLQAWFRRRGQTSEDAEDLAQETLARILRHLRRTGGPVDNLWPLAQTIARNLLIEQARRRRPEPLPIAAAAEIPCDHDEVDRRSDERVGLLQVGLTSLSPRHRNAIGLWMNGLGPAQIAQRLEIKRNAADALLHRARARLATAITNGPLGLVAVAWVGLRARARRLVHAVSSADPAGSLASSAAGLAVVVLAAVLPAASAGPTSLNGGPVPTEAAPSVIAPLQADPVETVLPDGPVPDGSPPQPEAEHGRTVEVDLSEVRFGASTRVFNPLTGEVEDLALDVWRETGDDPTISGRTLDLTTRAVCEHAHIPCRGGF